MQPLVQTLVASTLSLRDSRVQMRLSHGGSAFLFTQLAKDVQKQTWTSKQRTLYGMKIEPFKSRKLVVDSTDQCYLGR